MYNVHKNVVCIIHSKMLFDDSDNTIYDTCGLKWFSFPGMATLTS